MRDASNTQSRFEAITIQMHVATVFFLDTAYSSNSEQTKRTEFLRWYVKVE